MKPGVLNHGSIMCLFFSFSLFLLLFFIFRKNQISKLCKCRSKSSPWFATVTFDKSFQFFVLLIEEFWIFHRFYRLFHLFLVIDKHGDMPFESSSVLPSFLCHVSISRAEAGEKKVRIAAKVGLWPNRQLETAQHRKKLERATRGQWVSVIFEYCKVPYISPGAYRNFCEQLGGLIFEGLIHGTSNNICSVTSTTHFMFTKNALTK